MFTFNYAEGADVVSSLLVWLCVFSALFALNEVTRRFKWVGFGAFFVLPVVDRKSTRLNSSH